MKPILFNTEMVKAILEGRKTVTRRVVSEKVKDTWLSRFWECKKNIRLAPYQVGDILYVRETGMIQSMKAVGNKVKILFKADNSLVEFKVSNGEYSRLLNYESKKSWLSPYWLTKETARIFLKVTDVRVERLQDITEGGAKAEGCNECFEHLHYDNRNYRCAFEYLWDSVYNIPQKMEYRWECNPWVWVIDFERCDKV